MRPGDRYYECVGEPVSENLNEKKRANNIISYFNCTYVPLFENHHLEFFIIYYFENIRYEKKMITRAGIVVEIHILIDIGYRNKQMKNNIFI